MKRSCRSQSYQYLIKERPWDVEWFSLMQNQEQDSQRYLELRDELQRRLVELAKEKLTKRQLEILMLRLDGYTQTEIANILGCNQSTIVKTLSGNVRRVRNGYKKYGGIVTKLKKCAMQDERTLEILAEIEEELSQ